jgi:drug/metabolite transporter (DMT)-like permease
MRWFLYSVLCALCLATSDVFAKKILKDVDEYVVAWGRLIWSAPFIFLAVPLVPIPSITSTFLLIFIILLPLEITAIILYIKAIKISPLSLTIPFLGLTPVFLILTSFLILGELPDMSGTIGIILVAIGAYCLNINKTSEGLLAPLKAVYRERGSMLMVIVAFIYSITSNLGKIAALESNPIFFSTAYIVVLPLLFTPIAMTGSHAGVLKRAFSNPYFILLGFFYGVMIMLHMSAIVLVEVPYMISVKRSSLLFSIIYGKLVFSEKGFRERFIGCMIILIGIFFITIP